MKNPLGRFNYWVQSFVYSVLVVAILGLGFALSTPYTRVFDFSPHQRYSLQPETKEIFQKIGKRKVRMIGFFREGDPVVQEIESMLVSFRQYLPGLKFNQYDLAKHPDEAKRYGVHEQSVLLIEMEGKVYQLRELHETPLREALQHLSEPNPQLIFFATGHGEAILSDEGALGYSFIRDRLRNQGYRVKQDYLESPLLNEASLVIFAYPKSDLAPQELHLLENYSEQGSLIFLMDPEEEGVYPIFRNFLDELGIRLGNNVVLDRSSRLYGVDDLVSVVTDFAHHEILTDVEGSLYFPLSRSLDMKEDEAPGEWSKDFLVFSSKASWGETAYESLQDGTYAYDRLEDTKGPLALALALERKPDPQSRILVFGDSDFINNTNLNAGTNLRLFLNATTWALKEKIVSKVTAVQSQSTPFVLSSKQRPLAFWGMVALPASLSLFVFGGVFVFRQLFS